MKRSKTIGLFIIAAIYAIAVFIGFALFFSVSELHINWRILIGDVGATIFVFLTGVALKNASVYDPYWSLAPIVVLTGVLLLFDVLNIGKLLLIFTVLYWGVRLTCNWAYTFKNLATQDWRYDKLKRVFPRAFQLVSFLGINMFPTIVVYLCLLPGIAFLEESAFTLLTTVGFAVCIAATTLQLMSDIQMHRFKRKNADAHLLIRDGLWKHSRHPNYLGEILMWWGVYIMMLSSVPGRWFLAIGPVVNTLMFLFVSIPLADKHNRETRLGFDEYVLETNSLLPFKIKRAAK